MSRELCMDFEEVRKCDVKLGEHIVKAQPEAEYLTHNSGFLDTLSITLAQHSLDMVAKWSLEQARSQHVLKF